MNSGETRALYKKTNKQNSQTNKNIHLTLKKKKKTKEHDAHWEKIYTEDVIEMLKLTWLTFDLL